MRPDHPLRPRRLGAGVLVASTTLAATFALGGATAAADTVRSSQWYLSKLGVTQAWHTTKGAGVKIGIADSGVDGKAPDLRGVVVGGKDFSGTGVANGGVVNGVAHGTNVASLAAGRGHGTDAGVIGTAPRASIVSASMSFTGYAQTTPQAIRWLTDQGVRVINVSVRAADSPALRSAVAYAESKDVVLVAATGDVGNTDVTVVPPASLPGVVAVTGVDENLRRDPGATTGKGTALAAPFSTTATTPFSSKSYTGLTVAEPTSKPDAYSQVSGTSFSAPIVAGIVALIRAAHPDENAATVITRLLKSATPAGGSVPNTTYGYGIVNAAKAVSMQVAATDTNPLGSLAPANGGSSGASSGASTGSSSASTSSAPSTGSPPTPSSAPSSAAPAASGDSSSGIGTGGIVTIVVAVIVVVLVGGWLIARSRRHTGPPPPPGYGRP